MKIRPVTRQIDNNTAYSFSDVVEFSIDDISDITIVGQQTEITLYRDEVTERYELPAPRPTE